MMKEIIFTNPEFDVGDTVNFLNEKGLIERGSVLNISQMMGETNKLYYHIKKEEDGSEVIKNETDLLFNEISYVKPLFDIGMKILYKNDKDEEVVSYIEELHINIHAEKSKKGNTIYFPDILYTLDNKDLINEEEILGLSFGV